MLRNDFFVRKLVFSGLEVEDGVIKFVQAKDFAGAREIIKVIVKRAASSSEKDILTALKEITDETKGNIGHLTVCIPRHKVAVRFVRFPTQEEKEIAGMVELQSAKELPFAKEELISDYLITEKSADGYTKVALVIAQRSLINGYLEIFKKAKLQPQRITLSTEALQRWFQNALAKRELKDGSLLIDIDYATTDFTICYDYFLDFTRAVEFGSAQLATQPQLNNKLAEELKRTIGGYSRQEKTRKVSRLFLCQTGAATEAIRTYLERELNLPCEVISPLNNLSYQDGVISVLSSCEFSLAKVLGTVLEIKARGINLLPPAQRQKQQLQLKRKEILQVLFLGLAVILLGAIIFAKKIHDKKMRIFYLEREITRTHPLASDAENMIKKIELIKRRSAISGSSIDALRQLHLLTPADVLLTNFSYDEDTDTVALQGRSNSRSAIYKFIEDLEKSASFKNVQLKYVSEKKTDVGGGVNFSIECALER